ncbi:hypothetical protein D3C86_1511290 [compost metagenome]
MNAVAGTGQVFGNGCAQRAQAHHTDLEILCLNLYRALPELVRLLLQDLIETPVIVNHRPAYVLGHALAVRGIDHSAHVQVRAAGIGVQVIDARGNRMHQLQIGQRAQTVGRREPACRDQCFTGDRVIGQHYPYVWRLTGKGRLELAEQDAVARQQYDGVHEQ